MARKPKVFCWSNGLKVYTVATSSRAKALEAWGSELDLFKLGSAREIKGGPDFEAAQAAPGQVLELAADVDLGKLPKGEAKPRGKAKARPVRKPAGPTKAERERAARLTRELKALTAAQAREEKAAEAAVRRAEAALDKARADQRALAVRHRKAREKAEAALRKAAGRLIR